MNLSVLIFGLLVTVPLAYGQALDTPGLKEQYTIKVNNTNYEIEVVSNFEVGDVRYDERSKKITFQIFSGVKNNLAEILIPKDLSPDGFTFLLNGQDYEPKIASNSEIYFMTLRFNGSGSHTFDALIFEPEIAIAPEAKPMPDSEFSSEILIYVVIGVAIAGGVSAATVYFKKRQKP